MLFLDFFLYFSLFNDDYINKFDPVQAGGASQHMFDVLTKPDVASMVTALQCLIFAPSWMLTNLNHQLCLLNIFKLNCSNIRFSPKI